MNVRLAAHSVGFGSEKVIAASLPTWALENEIESKRGSGLRNAKSYADQRDTSNFKIDSRVFIKNDERSITFRVNVDTSVEYFI